LSDLLFVLDAYNDIVLRRRSLLLLIILLLRLLSVWIYLLLFILIYPLVICVY